MDFSKVFDEISNNLGLRTNSMVYNAFRDRELPEFQKAFTAYVERITQGSYSSSSATPLTDLNSLARNYLTEGTRKALQNKFLDFADRNGYAIQALTSAQSEPVPGSEYLRARYTIAEPSDVKESLTQQVSDTAQADLFNYVPPNSELGENNSLYLFNELNMQYRLHNANVKPLLDVPSVLGFNSAFNDQQYIPVYTQLKEDEMSELVQVPLRSLPGIGLLAGSNVRSVDPFTDKPQFSYMEPANPQPGDFGMDPNQPLGSAFNNYHGFVPWYDQQRHPLKPSVQAGPDMIESQQLVTAFLLGPQIY